MNKNLLTLILTFVLAIILVSCSADPLSDNDSSAAGSETNSGEIWTSDKFLAEFENFIGEVSFFIEFNHNLPLNNASVESYLNETLPQLPFSFDSLYITYMAYKLETELGTEFDKDDSDFYLIPKETVTNLLLQINSNLKENEIIYEEFHVYNADYLRIYPGFGGKLNMFKILPDTIEYNTETNIVKFDIQIYIAESDYTAENELFKLTYEFSPFLYKDTIQLYKFINVENVE
jgi:hypothetical protein